MNKREEFKSRTTFHNPAAHLKIKTVKFADGNSTTTVTGYPIVWGATSSDRGGYKVRLAKNSAQFTDPALALWHHDFSKPLGGTNNETLRILAADEIGVPIEIDLDTNTTAGSDTLAYVSSELVGGMSFSMANGFEDYSEDEEEFEGESTRIITVSKFTCDEVTITPIPAFSSTSVGMKTEEEPDDGLEPLPHGTPPIAGGMSEIKPTNRIMAEMRLRTMKLLNMRAN